MDINTLNVTELKKYLRENGATFPKNSRKPALKEQAFKVKKAKDLELVEQEICQDCGFSIDMCECERCDECFEIIKKCECQKLRTREKVKAMEEMAGPYLQMFQKFKQMANAPVPQPIPQPIPVKPKTPTKPKKKVILKRVVKKKVVKKKQPKKKQPIVVNYVEEIQYEDDELPRIRTEEETDDLETLIQISAYKIKIKVFLVKNIMPEPNIHQEVFTILDLILKKHYVILEEEEKCVFKKLFNRIYTQPNEKQKSILKDIVVYLVNCDFKSF